MKSVVVVFPASNCDRDAAVALEAAFGRKPAMVWHRETELPEADVVVLPGGFSYGDYLRCGAIAARSPVMRAVAARAQAGAWVIGVCNGFQILLEAGLLPGALLRNAGVDFVCRETALRVDGTSPLAAALASPDGAPRYLTCPVAHHDGRYFADADTLDRLEGEGRVAFRYVDNPNGSARDIAGIADAGGRVVGLMPHPERAISPLHGGVDGAAVFRALASA